MNRKFEWATKSDEHYHDTPNPYSEPEDCGLELLERFDEPDMSYEFNMFCFWKDKATGQIYCASDSGCSCPEPFENVTGLDDLKFCPTAQVAKDLFFEWNKRDDGKYNVSDLDAHRKIDAIFAQKNLEDSEKK